MNCGLGNLTSLKKHLLADSLAARTDFDEVIEDIGTLVAGAMENFCNRKFARGVGVQETFTADRASFQLSRYPVERITLVELKLQDSTGWEPQADSFVQSTSPESGLIYLPDNCDAARYWSQVRFTYDGGYWFETAEPDDDAYPSVKPDGATEVPRELRGAWLFQCRLVWDYCDKLGLATVDHPAIYSRIQELDWSPMIKGTLQRFAAMNPV